MLFITKAYQTKNPKQPKQKTTTTTKTKIPKQQNLLNLSNPLRKKFMNEFVCSHM
jgi:hypothetical protein